jgi:hypothetical protein
LVGLTLAGGIGEAHSVCPCRPTRAHVHLLGIGYSLRLRRACRNLDHFHGSWLRALPNRLPRASRRDLQRQQAATSMVIGRPDGGRSFIVKRRRQRLLRPKMVLRDRDDDLPRGLTWTWRPRCRRLGCRAIRRRRWRPRRCRGACTARHRQEQNKHHERRRQASHLPSHVCLLLSQKEGRVPPIIRSSSQAEPVGMLAQRPARRALQRKSRTPHFGIRPSVKLNGLAAIQCGGAQARRQCATLRKVQLPGAAPMRRGVQDARARHDGQPSHLDIRQARSSGHPGG